MIPLDKKGRKLTYLIFNMKEPVNLVSPLFSTKDPSEFDSSEAYDIYHSIKQIVSGNQNVDDSSVANDEYELHN